MDRRRLFLLALLPAWWTANPAVAVEPPPAYSQPPAASDEPLSGTRVRVRTSYRTTARTNARGSSPFEPQPEDEAVMEKAAATLSPDLNRSGQTLETPRYMACFRGGKRRPIADYRDDGDSFWVRWVHGGRARYPKAMIDRFESIDEVQAAEILAELEADATRRRTSAARSGATPADRPAPLRAYEEGPLTARDFAGEPPASRLGISAYTYTAINYTYGYRSIISAGVVRLVATRFEAEAVVAAEKSWNLSPGDVRLLDHEQGHFDITQLYTVGWRRRMMGLLRQGAISADGRTEAAARQTLQQRLQTAFQPLYDNWKAEQTRYDDETRHGLNQAAQDQWRERLDSELAGAS